MSDRSSIEWTDATWGPTLGCTRVSDGCTGCYAIRTAHRLAANPDPGISADYAGLTERRADRLDWTGQVRMLPHRLELPLHWRKPKRIFVDSQSDLFLTEVSTDFLARVWAVMALSGRHRYQILSKRAGRMRATLSSPGFVTAVSAHATALITSRRWARWQLDLDGQPAGEGWTSAPTPDGNLWQPPWPLPNVHLGVSVEDQRWAHIRIPPLKQTPAAVRWISAEPLLGLVDLTAAERHRGRTGGGPRLLDGLDWVVAGGESGPGCRPAHPDWFRSLRDQCAAGGVAFAFKQWGGWAPHPPDQPADARSVWVHPQTGAMPDPAQRPALSPVPGAVVMRAGPKKRNGRLLDGVLHEGQPAGQPEPVTGA